MHSAREVHFGQSVCDQLLGSLVLFTGAMSHIVKQSAVRKEHTARRATNRMCDVNLSFYFTYPHALISVPMLKSIRSVLGHGL